MQHMGGLMDWGRAPFAQLEPPESTMDWGREPRTGGLCAFIRYSPLGQNTEEQPAWLQVQTGKVDNFKPGMKACRLVTWSDDACRAVAGWRGCMSHKKTAQWIQVKVSSQMMHMSARTGGGCLKT